MSELAPLAPQNVPDGYAQRTVTVNGAAMTFTFYMGFVSRLTHTPEGGDEILVYQQEGVFRVPGGKAPDANSKLWITGGPDGLDVELEIEDGPLDSRTFQGPIQGFQVVTRRSGGNGQGQRVRALKGADQVASIRVQMRGQGGGVVPHMPGGGGSTDVTNTPITCPPNC